MLDALVAGAGPAGAIAALVLARAGARVVIVDRDEFPRDKLCGDTLNPGAVATLASIGLAGGPLARARRLAGMRVTGPRADVEARYGEGVSALAMTRCDLDAWLLSEAIRAGARFESGLVIRRALTEESGNTVMVRGLVLSKRGGAETRLPALMTIASDGRHSTVARSVGLVTRSHDLPRRWAFGAYATGVEGTTDVGEMHIRAGGYVGVAPITDSVVNVCVVTGPKPDGRRPMEIIRGAIARDPALAARFRSATFQDRVRVLGPLAVDVPVPGMAGLLLAGDAAGFIDPMTGDGLRLAIAGGIFAANESLSALETGHFAAAPARLAATRRAALGRKLLFNRTLRRMVERPLAVRLADLGARSLPAIVRRAILYAGDAE